jgi:hypothetical protein
MVSTYKPVIVFCLLTVLLGHKTKKIIKVLYFSFLTSYIIHKHSKSYIESMSTFEVYNVAKEFYFLKFCSPLQSRTMAGGNAFKHSKCSNTSLTHYKIEEKHFCFNWQIFSEFLIFLFLLFISGLSKVESAPFGVFFGSEWNQ